MKLIVGLGNPGTQYTKTRHNAGLLVLDRLVELHDLPNGLFIAYGKDGALLRPDVLMNESGRAVKCALEHHGFTAQNTLVICDDFNLPLGQLRLRGEGSAGGHRGLASIIEQLGTVVFPRLRVGIGAPPPHIDAAEFVLTPFTAAERQLMDPALTLAAQAADAWFHNGLEHAMLQFNRRTHPEES